MEFCQTQAYPKEKIHDIENGFMKRINVKTCIK